MSHSLQGVRWCLVVAEIMSEAPNFKFASAGTAPTTMADVILPHHFIIFFLTHGGGWPVVSQTSSQSGI